MNIAHQTILGGPISKHLENQIKKEEEGWSFAIQVCQKCLEAYQNGEISFQTFTDFVFSVTKISPASFGQSPQHVFYSFYEQGIVAIPKKTVKNKRKAPKFLKDLALSTLKKAKKDGYKINRAAINTNPERCPFLLVANLFRVRGINVNDNEISSWYYHPKT